MYLSAVAMHLCEYFTVGLSKSWCINISKVSCSLKWIKKCFQVIKSNKDPFEVVDPQNTIYAPVFACYIVIPICKGWMTPKKRKLSSIQAHFKYLFMSFLTMHRNILSIFFSE